MKNSSNKKKIYIKTYGCQMNVYDSEKMFDLMHPHGFIETKEYSDADLIILNTCHIREKAVEKVYSDLGRIAPVKKKAYKSGRKVNIIVAGCVAQAEGKEIVKRQPAVDIVVGPQTYHKLPELLFDKTSYSKSIVYTEFPTKSKFDELNIEKTSNTPSSFVSIQEGCDKFCTFCVVPYTRGVEYSRPALEIINEIKILSDKGTKEVCLLGQNVNAYHGESGKKIYSLSDLIKKIADINDIERIRYTTSHPTDMSDDLINTHGIVDKLMPYVHLPVQSGDDIILKKMNRKYTTSDYEIIIDKLRKVRADIAISSDFIVGFPGEDEKAFENTLKLVEKIKFSQSYSFKYSRRPGTPGSIMPKQVKEETKTIRLLELQKLLNDQQLEFNESFLRNKLDVLLERKGKNTNQFIGRSPYMQATHVENSNLIIGEIVNVNIVEATKNSLKGILADKNIETLN